VCDATEDDSSNKADNIKIEMNELNKYSKTITQDPTQPAAQAMLYGIGLTEDDLKKPQIGVCSMGMMVIHVTCT